MNHAATRRRTTSASLLITLAALAFGLTACTPGQVEGEPASAPAPATSPADDASPMGDADARHVCGQVSALAGIMFRSEWEHDQGLIDDTAYASRVAALEDGWTYMVVGDTEVSPAIAYAKRAQADGGVGRDNAAFQQAMEKVGQACLDAGSSLSIGALPGQGG